MTNAITILIFAVLLIVAMWWETTFGASKFDPEIDHKIRISIVYKCIDLELDQCGDKLCEMSDDSNYPIIKQAYDNLKDCIQREALK